MAMSALDKELINYFIQLDDLQKKSLLEMIKTLVPNHNTSFSQTTIEEYNKELDDAEAEFERGDYTAHDEMKALVRKW